MHLRRNPRRTLRRSVAVALGGLVLASPLLTSCGFNYATDRVYTPAAGVNNRDASVDVLGAVVVSAQDGSGTFIATFSNNDHTKKASVDTITGGNGSSLQVANFKPISLDPGGLVNLATAGGVPVSGTFKAGDLVDMTITFGNGERADLSVPVVTDSGDYAGLDISSSTATPSESPSDSSSASPSGSASESPSESPSASASE